MTVSASSTVQTATGNGSQTSFSYTFKNYQSSDLDVYVNKILQVSGYSVTINSDFNGGNVVFSVAPTNGHAIKILRKQDLTQSFDPQIYQSINELDLESTFDKVVMQIQELKEQADRAARVPPYFNGFDAIYPEPEALTIPRFNAANNAWELVTSETIVTEGGGGGGGGGTLSSIGMTVPTDVLSVSPASLSADGTFAISKVSQAQNAVAAGPTSGSGAWTFRALVAGDIPSLDAAKITSGAFAKARQHASTAYIDQSNTFTGGFVQSFADPLQTLVLPQKSTPGSPVQGEIYIDGTALKFRDASGPTNRTVISDAFQISTTSPLTGGGALTANLTLALGTVPIANGGLGSTTWSAADLAVMNNAGTAFTRLPLGTNGQFLSINTGLNPQFEWVTGGSGVTSVAMTLPSALFTTPPSGSPITSSGTLAVALASQSANTHFCAPDGSAGTPTFRALVNADLPTITTAKGGTNLTTYTTGDLIYASAANTLSKLPIGTSGQLLAVSAGGIVEWITASGTGTVTSVAMTLPSALFTTPPSGSPITTSGTFAVALASQTQNLIFASPDGSSGTPTFRSMVAGDVPNLTASKITSGALAIAVGGTNNSSLSVAAGAVPRGDGSKLVGLALGTAGQSLRVNAAANDIIWGATANPFNVRATLTTGTPFTSSDVLAATSVFITPCLGNKISLHNGSSAWIIQTFAEILVAVPATTNTNYDVFVQSASATTITGSAVAWTNDTTRATAIVLQDGVWVKSGDTTSLYVCSFRTTGVSGQTEDSTSKRFLSNAFNKTTKEIKSGDTTDTWTYTSATFREINGGSTDGVSRISFLIGEPHMSVEVVACHVYSNSTAGVVANTGVGLDTSTTLSSDCRSMQAHNPAANLRAGLFAFYKGKPGVGLHNVRHLENSQAIGTGTFYGDNGAASFQTGMIGTISM